MRLRVVAVVCLLVATAGCNAFAGDANTPTLTPAEVPTVPPTPTDPRIGVAPGVSTTDVTHPAFLAQHHVAAVENASYVWTMRYEQTRRTGSVTANVSRAQRVVVENETTYRRDTSAVERRIDGDVRFLSGYSEYADGDVRYRSWIGGSDGGRVFRRDPEPAPRPPFARVPEGRILQYLDLSSVTVTRYYLADSDARYYLVRGTRESLPAVTTLENYTATALIREDGFVRQLNVTYSGTDRGTNVTTRFSFAYTDVGTAEVTPPDWIDEARAQFEDG